MSNGVSNAPKITPATETTARALGVHSRLQALIFALRSQLVELRSTEC